MDIERSAAGPAGPSGWLICLVTLAIMYTLYFAANLLIPIVAALLLYFLLSPIVNRLVAFGLVRSVAAFVVLATLVAMIAVSLVRVSEPGMAWLQEAPTSVAEFREKLSSRPNPLADVRNATDAVEEAVEELTGSANASRRAAQPVAISEPGIVESVLSALPVFLASALVTIVLTLFLLIFGDRLKRRIVATASSLSAKKRFLRILNQVEHDIARYLGTVTLINIGLGIVVAGAMALIGLPNPILWGVIATVLNFAPYLGALIMILILIVAGVSTFDAAGTMALPALVFFLITTIEGQIVTPMLLGQRLEMNPLIVFTAVLLMAWLWGLPGGLLAVPLVASIRIVFKNTPHLRHWADLMAR